MSIMDIISNRAFIDFLSTFGLAVLLVMYFVLIRDPKKDKFWQTKYDELIKNYEQLSNNYIRLEDDLRPETRKCSPEQGVRLTDLGLDRDLYKLYYYISEKLDGRRREDIGVFIAESIRATNEAWSKFKSPFQRVERIGDLYGVYVENGEPLRVDLEKILQGELSDDEKKAKVWNLLFTNTVNMKREFQECLHNLSKGIPVSPYQQKN